MKYLIMIHHNQESMDAWQSFSSEERAQGLDAYRALNEELAASGEMIVTTALADASMAKRVRRGPDGVTATDGPFAEIKEQFAGIYLVECDSLERAVEIAGLIPEADMGMIEVRPTLDLSDFDM